MKTPQFQVIKGENNKYYFKLTTEKSEIAFSGEGYKSKFDCINDIERIRKNCLFTGHFVIRVAQSGQIYFVLKSPNEEIICKSGIYESILMIEKDILALQRNARRAEINCLM